MSVPQGYARLLGLSCGEACLVSYLHKARRFWACSVTRRDRCRRRLYTCWACDLFGFVSLQSFCLGCVLRQTHSIKPQSRHDLLALLLQTGEQDWDLHDACSDRAGAMPYAYCDCQDGYGTALTTHGCSRVCMHGL